MCPERWEYPNLVGSGANQTLSCFRGLLEHQSTTASLNTRWFLFPIHTSQRTRRDWRGNDSFLHSSQLLLEAVGGNSPAASLLTSEIRPWRALTHPMCYGPNNSKLLLGATSNSFSFACCQLPFSCGSALRTSKTPPSISLIFFLFAWNRGRNIIVPAGAGIMLLSTYLRVTRHIDDWLCRDPFHSGSKTKRRQLKNTWVFLLNSNWKRYRWGFHFHNPLLLHQIRSQHIEKPNHLTTRRIIGFMIPGAYPPVLTGFCVMSQLQTISLCFLSCTWTALCVTELWSRKHPHTHTHSSEQNNTS